MVAAAGVDRHLLELADDVRDMGQRVLGNGAEPCYAGEKLGWAAERAVCALTLLGWRREDIAELVERAVRHGHWLAGRERAR